MGYATVSIAGVALEVSSVPCRNYILDGANVLLNHTGTSRFSASGEVFTQVLAITTGQRFGIKSDFLPASVISSIVSAVNSAMNGGAGSFNVTATDELQTINESVVPDYDSGWLQVDGQQRMDADAIKNVVFRFIVA